MPETDNPLNEPLERFLRVEREASSIGSGIEAVPDGDIIRFQETKSHAGYGLLGCSVLYLAGAFSITAAAYQSLSIVGGVMAGVIFATGFLYSIYSLITQGVQQHQFLEIDTGKRKITGVIPLTDVERFLGWSRYDNEYKHDVYAVTVEGKMLHLASTDEWGAKRIPALLGFICDIHADFKDMDDRLIVCYTPGDEVLRLP